MASVERLNGVDLTAVEQITDRYRREPARGTPGSRRASSGSGDIEKPTVGAEGIVNLSAAYGVEEGSPGFERIELTVTLEGDASREDVQSIVDDALESAPIPNTVARPVPVAARLA